MIITENIEQVRRERWADPGASWGLVPTMGALHDGHLSLVRAARAENDRVAASIYVNPTQFAPTEDLDAYPRQLARDLDLLRAEGVDLVFTPSDAVMYPSGYQTYVSVENITRVLEGASRPTHFRGVATVVAKLFNIVQPTRAYFGQKDAQQTVVIRQMVRDLNFDVDVVICPIVREPDGLAMSSRNQYLHGETRAAATVLYRALMAVQAAFARGERDANFLRALMTDTIAAEKLARPDYVSIADPLTLTELETISGTALCSLAVFFGKTRLIDNLILEESA